MDFFSNMLKCAPCGSKKKMKQSRVLLMPNARSSRPRLSYKQGKVFNEEKTKKVFSALCISTSASGIGVIVKRFKIADPLTPQKVEMCEKLVQLIEKTKRIEHPNLVRYLEASYDLDTQYFEIITEQLPISLEENQVTDEWHTKIYIMQILEAIEYLQNIGFSYLNIKLNNILFDHYGNLKIRDYIGNHYIECLMSADDSFDEMDDSRVDAEADIKGFMNILRNIGMYKVKFKNASSYNGLIFFLENLRKWNFSRIRSDKFFSDIDQDGNVHSSFQGFVETRTVHNNKKENPIFFTAEEPKNIFKGHEKAPLKIDAQIRTNDAFNESDAFLKNLHRVQGLKNAKNVGMVGNQVKENKGPQEVKRMQTGTDIAALRMKQKELEECFGSDDNDVSSSVGNDKTQKIVLNTIPSQYDDTPKLKRSPFSQKQGGKAKLTLRHAETVLNTNNSVYEEKDSEILVQDLSDVSLSYVKRSTNKSKEKVGHNDSMVDKSPDLTYLNQNRHLDAENRIKRISPKKGRNFKKKQDAQVYELDLQHYKNFNTSKRTDLELKTDRSIDPNQNTFVSQVSPERLLELRNNSESQHDILNVLKMLNGQKSMRFGSNIDMGSYPPSENAVLKGNSNEIKNNSTQYYLARRSQVNNGINSGTPKTGPKNGFNDVNINEFYRDSWVKGEPEPRNDRDVGGRLNFNL